MFSLSMWRVTLSGYDSPASSLSLSPSLSPKHVTLHVCNEEEARERLQSSIHLKTTFIFSVYFYNTIKINWSLNSPKTSKKLVIAFHHDPSFSPKETNKKNQMSQKVWTTKPMIF